MTELYHSVAQIVVREESCETQPSLKQANDNIYGLLSSDLRVAPLLGPVLTRLQRDQLQQEKNKLVPSVLHPSHTGAVARGVISHREWRQ